MNWKNPEQVATFFDLAYSAGDEDTLRRTVAAKMATIHPDANSEQFLDEDSEKLWHQLNSAKDFLDNHSSGSSSAENELALIPASQVSAIISSLAEVSRPPLEVRVAAIKSEARANERSRGFIRRLSSGFFATVSAFLFTFSSSVKDHPLIGEWFQTSTAQMGLLTAMLYSGMFFLMTWVGERRHEELVDFLSTEEGLRETLARVINRPDGGRKFTTRDLTDCLLPLRHRQTSFLFAFFRRGLSRSIADQIAEIHASKLLERGVAIELGHEGLHRTFEISRAIYSELLKQDDP